MLLKSLLSFSHARAVQSSYVSLVTIFGLLFGYIFSVIYSEPLLLTSFISFSHVRAVHTSHFTFGTSFAPQEHSSRRPFTDSFSGVQRGAPLRVSGELATFSGHEVFLQASITAWACTETMIQCLQPLIMLK